MVCKTHHDQIDGRTRPRLVLLPLTDAGADGPIIAVEQMPIKGMEHVQVIRF